MPPQHDWARARACRNGRIGGAAMQRRIDAHPLQLGEHVGGTSGCGQSKLDDCTMRKG
eukprot:CAMPEP_0119397200 /NCGR_PEP_ID=MMETSP1334-20130426/139938_1 /TAXON_ID=127549 /ORGANISM="Calcidiscus leptoporus, Strain RCC1130" /LENGTH=57 /DNA_ID=CAMNT_0007421013 /DNA_START=16 /DNA_END=187 /DNA_ORIENTATION=-